MASNRTHYRSAAVSKNPQTKGQGDNLTRSKTLFATLALAVTLPVTIAACGGDEGSDADPQEVIEEAFNNDTKLESGVVDLTLDFSAEGSEGGSLAVNLNGPFTMDPDNPEEIGQIDWDVSVTGEGAAAAGLPGDIEAGITVTEDNLYVNYDDTDYELGEEAFTELQEQQAAATPDSEDAGSIREQCEQAIETQGGDPAACDIDVTAWFSELENEGSEDVGGSETTHVSGQLDVEQMVSDLFNLGASVPGATGGIDPSLIEPQLSQISEAVSGADFDVYGATEDGTLRGLDFGLELDAAALGGGAAGVDAASIGFSLEIADVGEEQTFEAPSDPQPIEELAEQFGGLGAIPGGSSLGGGGSGDAGTIDGDCITDAAGDPDAIQKCLE